MSRSKGARLWLRPASGREKQSVWLIRDGRHRESTGCGPGEREEAEAKLSAYLAAKHIPPRQRDRDPASIRIADVLSIYATDKGASVARPVELGQRLEALLKFWGRMTLADVTGHQCRAYVAQSSTPAWARRCLEDLRAAINHHRREGFHREIIDVVLPPRSRSRERWLTREEAADLIRAAWRFEQRWRTPSLGPLAQRREAVAINDPTRPGMMYDSDRKGVPVRSRPCPSEGDYSALRHPRRHVARFILIGLYTGTRSSAICNAALMPTIGRGYVDLGAGLFHRRAIGAAETKKRQPAIQIPDRLLAHMRRWAKLGLSKTAVIEFDGEPVKSVKKAFKRAAEAAGLAGVTPHTLRHSAASWAMQAGANVAKTAEYLGMTEQVLLKVYGHMRPDHHREVGEAITGRRR